MFGDGGLTFREMVMREPLPISTIQQAVIDFLRDRDDAAVYGAMAVNAYVNIRRLTEDVDILSPRAKQLAEELREYLHKRFHIAVRVRQVKGGLGYRIYQVLKPENRHLVDLRTVQSLPPTQRVEDVLVVTPAELIAGKVNAYAQRRGRPKSFTDMRDLAVLLLKFPELKTDPGPVRDRLEAAGADETVLATWQELLAQKILPEEEDDEFGD